VIAPNRFRPRVSAIRACDNRSPGRFDGFQTTGADGRPVRWDLSPAGTKAAPAGRRRPPRLEDGHRWL